MPKIYDPNEWTDEQLTEGAEYSIDGGAPVTIELTTDVAVAGTGVTAERMNNIENGVDGLDTKLADALDLLTTGGTSTAYTITTIGAADLVSGETFRVKFHVTAGTTPTLNRDAKGAKDIKYYDAAGAKQAVTYEQIIENTILPIIYDGTDYVLLIGIDRVGGSSLTYNATTVTTGNVTAAEDNVYNCTIAGMTANRSVVLPAPSEDGKIIRVNILDGDVDYSLILVGDTGVTINGGSAATEWSRLFIAGETVTLESTSTSNWQVIEDGRIASKGAIRRAAAQTISTSSITLIQVDNSDVNIGNVTDLTNYRIIIRRTGIYQLAASSGIAAVPNQTQCRTYVQVDGTTESFGAAFISLASGTAALQTQTTAVQVHLTAGSYVDISAWQDSGSNKSTGTAKQNHPFLSVTEVL